MKNRSDFEQFIRTCAGKKSLRRMPPEQLRLVAKALSGERLWTEGEVNGLVETERHKGFAQGKRAERDASGR